MTSKTIEEILGDNIALDREELTENGKTVVETLRDETGLAMLPIITLRDIINYVDSQANDLTMKPYSKILKDYQKENCKL